MAVWDARDRGNVAYPAKLKDLGDVRMIKGVIGRVCVAVWLGSLTAAAVQLPPEALLVKAESTPLPECEQWKWNTKAYFQAATVESVTACLGAGANPMARDKSKNTPLHDAAEFTEDLAVIEALLKAGADQSLPGKAQGFRRSHDD